MGNPGRRGTGGWNGEDRDWRDVLVPGDVRIGYDGNWKGREGENGGPRRGRGPLGAGGGAVGALPLLVRGSTTVNGGQGSRGINGVCLRKAEHGTEGDSRRGGELKMHFFVFCAVVCKFPLQLIKMWCSLIRIDLEEVEEKEEFETGSLNFQQHALNTCSENGEGKRWVGQ